MSRHKLTPLHEAVLGTSPVVAKCLIVAGADVGLRDANGFTAADLCRRRARPGDAAWEQLVALLESADAAKPAAKLDEGRAATTA
jgi:ankyrin repeat protein